MGAVFWVFQVFFVGKKWLKCNWKMRKQLTFFALLFDDGWGLQSDC